MPRQRSAGRPTVSRAPAPSPLKQQPARPASSYAAHPAPPPPAAPHAAAPQQPIIMAAPAQQGPGLFGQMASTAAGVAIGSSVGHAIGGLFSGGGSSAPAESPQAAAPPAQQYAPPPSSAQQESWGANCQGATQQFTKCLDEQSGNMQICGWYLEQLKACQAAAANMTTSHY